MRGRNRTKQAAPESQRRALRAGADLKSIGVSENFRLNRFNIKLERSATKKLKVR